MNPGKRDKRIVIEHKTEKKRRGRKRTPGRLGSFSKAWAKAETPVGSGFNSEIFKEMQSLLLS